MTIEPSDDICQTCNWWNVRTGIVLALLRDSRRLRPGVGWPTCFLASISQFLRWEDETAMVVQRSLKVFMRASEAWGRFDLPVYNCWHWAWREVGRGVVTSIKPTAPFTATLISTLAPYPKVLTDRDGRCFFDQCVLRLAFSTFEGIPYIQEDLTH